MFWKCLGWKNCSGWKVGVPASGGAADFETPERRRRPADGAEACDDGIVDCGEVAPFRLARAGEEGERTTADVSVCADLDGEGRNGGGARRRRRRRRVRGRERRREGECAKYYDGVPVLVRNFILVLVCEKTWVAELILDL